MRYNGLQHGMVWRVRLTYFFMLRLVSVVYSKSNSSKSNFCPHCASVCQKTFLKQTCTVWNWPHLCLLARCSCLTNVLLIIGSPDRIIWSLDTAIKVLDYGVTQPLTLPGAFYLCPYVECEIFLHFIQDYYQTNVLSPTLCRSVPISFIHFI